MQKLLFLLLLVASASQGQIKPGKTIGNIQNTRTPKHVNIPGTRLYLVLPPGYTVSSGFAGIQKNDNTALVITDLVGGNFYSNAATFNKAGFEQKGAKVFDYQEITVGGYPAKFVFMQGDEVSKCYALVFGDSTFSTMIMGIYPPADKAADASTLQAINSIYYNKNHKIDPFASAFFSFNGKASKFRFAKFAANLYMYSTNGEIIENYGDDPMMMVLQTPKDGSTSLSEMANSLVLGEKHGFKLIEKKNINTMKINGYDAYQMEVYGEMKDKPVMIYYCLVANGDKAVALQGIAHSAFDSELKEFRKLAHSIQLK